MSEREVDVAIVGGGMVGAALALALARSEFSVALIETRAPEMNWDDQQYDLRVSALTRASQQLLQNLDAWRSMVVERVTPYQTMCVWDRAGFGEIRFAAADIGEPNLGHIVENRVIVKALWQQLSATSTHIVSDRRVSGLTLGPEQGELTFDDGSHIRAGLICGADGARSQLRDLAGIEISRRDYDQHAVVATVQSATGNRATAWQHFLPTGPLALLPMTRDLFSIVWSTSPQQADELCSLPVDEFETNLVAASESRAGTLSLCSERARFPLQIAHANEYVRPGIALVGDAAHVIHPLAGQGVNLGLLDSAALVDALSEGRRKGRRPGALRDLRQYERARRGHNMATALAMDGFKHLFSNSSLPLSLLRNAGLGLADRVAPLRNLCARVALGSGMDLPSLSRPPSR